LEGERDDDAVGSGVEDAEEEGLGAAVLVDVAVADELGPIVGDGVADSEDVGVAVPVLAGVRVLDDEALSVGVVVGSGVPVGDMVGSAEGLAVDVPVSGADTLGVGDCDAVDVGLPLAAMLPLAVTLLLAVSLPLAAMLPLAVTLAPAVTEPVAEPETLLVAAADALLLGDSDRMALPLGGALTEGEAPTDREALPEPLGVWLVDDASEAAALPDGLPVARGTLRVTLAPLLLVPVAEMPDCVADGDVCILPVRVPLVVDDGALLLAVAAGLRLPLPLGDRLAASTDALGLAVATVAALPTAAGCTSAGAPRRLTTVPPPSAPSCGSTKLPVCSGGFNDTSTKSPMTTSRPASPPTLLAVRADVRKRMRLVFASGTAIVAGKASPLHSAGPMRRPVRSLFRPVDHAMSVGAPSRAAPVADSTVMSAHITRAPHLSERQAVCGSAADVRRGDGCACSWCCDNRCSHQINRRA